MSEQPPLSVRIAVRVRGLAAERNVTQGQIGERLGLAQSAISKRFREVTPWSLDELERLCEYLDVSFALVIDDVLAAAP